MVRNGELARFKRHYWLIERELANGAGFAIEAYDAHRIDRSHSHSVLQTH